MCTFAISKVYDFYVRHCVRNKIATLFYCTKIKYSFNDYAYVKIRI